MRTCFIGSVSDVDIADWTLPRDVQVSVYPEVG